VAEEKKKEKKGLSKEEKEEIKRFVEWAIAQNPLVYRRLADL
jgi:hypothetical protein